jgi:serine/threonine protein kinase
MIFWKASGQIEFGPLSNALVMHYPNYMILGVAVVISHVVTRLGQQVAKERELGSYRLGDLLGQGGMGEVYRATHRMLARPAAIKLIRREVLTAETGRWLRWQSRASSVRPRRRRS